MSYDLSTLGAGGAIIAVLLVLSALSLALIVVKTVQLWPARAGAARRAKRMGILPPCEKREWGAA